MRGIEAPPEVQGDLVLARRIFAVGAVGLGAVKAFSVLFHYYQLYEVDRLVRFISSHEAEGDAATTRPSPATGRLPVYTGRPRQQASSPFSPPPSAAAAACSSSTASRPTSARGRAALTPSVLLPPVNDGPVRPSSRCIPGSDPEGAGLRRDGAPSTAAPFFALPRVVGTPETQRSASVLVKAAPSPSTHPASGRPRDEVALDRQARNEQEAPPGPPGVTSVPLKGFMHTTGGAVESPWRADPINGETNAKLMRSSRDSGESLSAAASWSLPPIHVVAPPSTSSVPPSQLFSSWGISGIGSSTVGETYGCQSDCTVGSRGDAVGLAGSAGDASTMLCRVLGDGEVGRSGGSSSNDDGAGDIETHGETKHDEKAHVPASREELHRLSTATANEAPNVAAAMAHETRQTSHIAEEEGHLPMTEQVNDEQLRLPPRDNATGLGDTHPARKAAMAPDQAIRATGKQTVGDNDAVTSGISTAPSDIAMRAREDTARDDEAGVAVAATSTVPTPTPAVSEAVYTSSPSPATLRRVHLFVQPRWALAPSVSPPCTQWEAFLRLHRIPYEVHEVRVLCSDPPKAQASDVPKQFRSRRDGAATSVAVVKEEKRYPLQGHCRDNGDDDGSHADFLMASLTATSPMQRCLRWLEGVLSRRVSAVLLPPKLRSSYSLPFLLVDGEILRGSLNDVFATLTARGYVAGPSGLPEANGAATVGAPPSVGGEESKREEDGEDHVHAPKYSSLSLSRYSVDEQRAVGQAVERAAEYTLRMLYDVGFILEGRGVYSYYAAQIWTGPRYWDFFQLRQWLVYAWLSMPFVSAVTEDVQRGLAAHELGGLTREQLYESLHSDLMSLEQLLVTSAGPPLSSKGRSAAAPAESDGDSQLLGKEAYAAEAADDDEDEADPVEVAYLLGSVPGPQDCALYAYLLPILRLTPYDIACIGNPNFAYIYESAAFHAFVARMTQETFPDLAELLPAARPRRFTGILPSVLHDVVRSGTARAIGYECCEQLLAWMHQGTSLLSSLCEPSSLLRLGRRMHSAVRWSLCYCGRGFVETIAATTAVISNSWGRCRRVLRYCATYSSSFCTSADNRTLDGLSSVEDEIDDVAENGDGSDIIAALGTAGLAVELHPARPPHVHTEHIVTLLTASEAGELSASMSAAAAVSTQSQELRTNVEYNHSEQPAAVHLLTPKGSGEEDIDARQPSPVPTVDIGRRGAIAEALRASSSSSSSVVHQQSPLRTTSSPKDKRLRPPLEVCSRERAAISSGERAGLSVGDANCERDNASSKKEPASLPSSTGVHAGQLTAAQEGCERVEQNPLRWSYEPEVSSTEVVEEMLDDATSEGQDTTGGTTGEAGGSPEPTTPPADDLPSSSPSPRVLLTHSLPRPWRRRVESSSSTAPKGGSPSPAPLSPTAAAPAIVKRVHRSMCSDDTNPRTSWRVKPQRTPVAESNTQRAASMYANASRPRNKA